MKRAVVSTFLALLAVAPAAAQTTRSPFEGDARLDRKITIHWKKATLYEALQEVSRATGVRMNPDRALVDEPVMASVTNVPARKLLEQTAALLHFTWMKSGGTAAAPGYLLFQDRVAKEEEQAEIDGARRAVLQALDQELDKYRRISKLPPDELQRRLDQSDQELANALRGGIASLGSDLSSAKKMQDGMAARAVASPLGKAMLDLVDGLAPGQWQQLMQEQPLTFSTRPEPGEVALPAGIADRMRGASPGIPFPKSILSQFGPGLDGALTKAEEMMQQQWGQADGFRIKVQMNLGLTGQPVGMLRVSPEPLNAGTMGMLFAASGLNIVGSPTLTEEPKEDPAEREKRLAADPVLGKKAKLKLPPLKPQTGFLALLGSSYRVADILPAVEEAYGVRLIGDAYNRQAMSVIPPPGEAEIPLYRLLDQMSALTRNWELDGDIVRLKSKTWAHDRRSEIPARYMNRWLAIRDRKGGFSLDDLAEIAITLRDEQVESLMFSAMEGGGKDFTDFVMVSMNRDILRFYGKLLPLQKKTLASGKGLPIRGLYPYQQAQLLNLNRGGRGQSMFAMFTGKPPRRPEQLAGGVLSLESAALAQPEEMPRPGGEGNVVTGIGLSGSLVTIRITLADGQKDEYNIPLSRSTPGEAKPEGPGELPEPQPQ